MEACHQKSCEEHSSTTSLSPSQTELIINYDGEREDSDSESQLPSTITVIEGSNSSDASTSAQSSAIDSNRITDTNTTID